MLEMAHKPKVVSTRGFGVIAFGSLFASIFLLVAPYYISPQSYIQKANPAWGYTSPNILETSVILGGALVLLVFAIFAFSLLGLRLD
jgi:hypothetical protein